MSDEGYWRARLRRLQDQVQAHLDAVSSEPGEGSREFLRGYDAGRRTAYARCLLLIGGLRREWAGTAAREAQQTPLTAPLVRPSRIVKPGR